jgi:hypothetical protein
VLSRRTGSKIKSWMTVSKTHGECAKISCMYLACSEHTFIVVNKVIDINQCYEDLYLPEACSTVAPPGPAQLGSGGYPSWLPFS